MPVYKDDKTNTWYVKRRYKDRSGTTKNLTKRGFALKREAVEWENNFLQRQSGELSMTFATFYQVYKEDMGGRLKEITWVSKARTIEQFLLPYFGEMRMQDITSADVIRWQNSLISAKNVHGKPFAATYLKTMSKQLNAIFNHAVKHYKLDENPAHAAGSIGSNNTSEMQVWTREEYRRFSEAIKDRPVSYHCFEMLYWCGIREGELLALTPADFDFDKKEVSINKTFHRIKGRDVITPPKTEQSIRKIAMPDFLCREMREFIALQYGIQPTDRLFTVSVSYLLREIERGAQAAGIKRIRVHDMRHSHVSLLIDMGYSAVAIAKRVGHRSIDITFRYAHLFPSVQMEMVKQLDKVKTEEGENEYEE